MNVNSNLKMKTYKLAYLSAFLFAGPCFIAPLNAMDDSSKDNKKGTPLKKAGKEKDDKNFPQMTSLASEISNLEKETLSPQTPTPQAKKNLLPPQSAPPQLIREKRQDGTNKNFTTPIQSNKKPKIPSTDPLPKKKKSTEEIYQDQIYVSNKFLDFKKREFISKKAHLLFIDFLKDYNFKKQSTLDITGLSARSRIYLLNSIINFKIQYLPDYGARNYDSFCKWTFPSNGFWGKKTSVRVADFIDQVPTTFKIGDFSYKLQQGATFHQKGSGRLYGLIALDTAEKYEQICPHLQKHPEAYLKNFSTLLLDQKKNGKTIDTKNVTDNRLLNGLNLLFDYEVARRLAKDDKYGKLPIINYISFIIQNLHNTKILNEFLVLENSSLFAGSSRENNARDLIPELNYTQNSKKQIRSNLKYLHSSDEDSQDEYSGDEEGFFVPKMQSLEAALETIPAPEEEAIAEKKETKRLESIKDDVKKKKMNADEVNEPKRASSTNKEKKDKFKKEKR